MTKTHHKTGVAVWAVVVVYWLIVSFALGEEGVWLWLGSTVAGFMLAIVISEARK